MMEIFKNLDANQQIALISAGAALLSAIIGALATLVTTWLNKKVQSSGKVSLYAKLANSKGSINRSWGFYKSEKQIGTIHASPNLA